jgi:hypothetical protein
MIQPYTIERKIEEFEAVQAAGEQTRAEYESRRMAILMPIIDDLDALEAEYQPIFDGVADRMANLERDIKHQTSIVGRSFRGHRIAVVYSRGRVSWDTKALDSYARIHPEVLGFRKEGAPIISFRQRKHDSYVD